MIERLPFTATSCHHDFRYYSVFYGEPFIQEEFLHYCDGYDLRVIGFDRRGNCIPEELLRSLVESADSRYRLRSVRLELPHIRNLRQGIPRRWKSEVVARPNVKWDYEFVLDGDPLHEKAVRKFLRRAKNHGLHTTVRRRKRLLTEDYQLFDKFVREWEPTPYFGAEFSASLVQLIERRDAVMVDCRRGDKIEGFALGTILGSFGVVHLTIAPGRQNGVSDMLHAELIGALRAKGAKRISLGFSFQKGLHDFKSKWGALRGWSGSYEVCLHRGGYVPTYLWASRLARLS